MAKINHHNFVDTINDILSEAKKRGVLQLEFEGEDWQGDKVKIQNRDFVNFGTCGYMGLEGHPKIIEETINFTERYGTQFSVSRTYLVSKQNYVLEEYLSEIFSKKPVIAFTSTTMAHLSVLPIIISHEDAIILDQQAHISIQTAAQQMAPKGVPIDIIRHSNLEMLEHKIKSIYDKYDRIWYMIDGVYSMYGDIAPIDEINQLMEKYEKLHLYVDDAHGMSWHGKNGCGRLYAKCAENNKTMYITTMAKGFGTMGGIAVFPYKTWYDKLILHGGPLAYSHPLPPPMLGAAIGSAKLHLSHEINEIQQSLKEKLDYANMLFAQTDIPILSNPETPIYFVGTGQPTVGYNLNKRIIDEGFYVNIGMFPAVPVKNTGLRFTITNHNSKAQIKSFIDALAHHYPLVMQEENKTVNEVRKAFRLPVKEEDKNPKRETENDFIIVTTNTILDIDKKDWDDVYLHKGNFGWDALRITEASFSNNELIEENWKFHYLLIYSSTKELVLATFFTSGIFKDDLLSPSKVSEIIEERRKENKYYLCSRSLIMGSLFSEGEHLYLNRTSPNWQKAVQLMMEFAQKIQDDEQLNSVNMRDFDATDHELSDAFHTGGFFKVQMPNRNQIDNLQREKEKNYFDLLSTSSRKHIRKDVLRHQDLFELEVKNTLNVQELDLFYSLYKNVAKNNFAINIFTYPKKLFSEMNASDNWEFLILNLKLDDKTIPVAITCCFKTSRIYCPILVGIDYLYNEKYHVYKQLLYRLVCNVRDRDWNKLFLGLTADIEKRKIGALQLPSSAFINIKDQFNMELIENISM